MSRHLSGSTASASATQAGTTFFLSGSLVVGSIGIFVHEAGVHPLTATWFRCAFGLLGLTCWIGWRRRTGELCLARPTAWPVLAAGVSMVAAWCMFFAAIERTSAGVASVLFHVQPLWVLLLGAWWLKEPVAPARMVSVVVAMVGLALATGMVGSLFTSPTAAGGGQSIDYWVGVGLCIVGALCTAGVTLIAHRTTAVPASVLAWWQCAVGTVALAAWPITQGWPAWGMSWAWLSGLGLLHTGLAYGLIYAGVARLPIDRVAVLQFVYPAVAIVLDWLVYDKRLGPGQLAGIMVMAVAIWFAEPQRKRAARY